MYDSILLPTDGSDGMERVAEYALDLADMYNAELHVLYVVDQRIYALTPVDTHEGIGDTLEQNGKDAIADIEDYADTADYDGELTPNLAEGIPGRAILNYSMENDLDLIVMGTHGETAETRALGSVADIVIRHSPIPVQVVRLNDPREDDVDDLAFA